MHAAYKKARKVKSYLVINMSSDEEYVIIPIRDLCCWYFGNLIHDVKPKIMLVHLLNEKYTKNNLIRTLFEDIQYFIEMIIIIYIGKIKQKKQSFIIK